MVPKSLIALCLAKNVAKKAFVGGALVGIGVLATTAAVPCAANIRS